MYSHGILMELIANNALWYYESYDHKAAIDDMIQTDLKNGVTHSVNSKPMTFQDKRKYFVVDDELKLKHRVWRVGKLRDMSFNPDGTIKKLSIGRKFLFRKTYYLPQIGIKAIPIISRDVDRFKLIKNGVAIDITTIKDSFIKL